MLEHLLPISLKTASSKAGIQMKPQRCGTLWLWTDRPLLLRELIIQGNGSQLRVRAVVTRKVTDEDIVKRASLIRHDSIHGPFRGNVIEDLENKCIIVNGNM